MHSVVSDSAVNHGTSGGGGDAIQALELLAVTSSGFRVFTLTRQLPYLLWTPGIT